MAGSTAFALPPREGDPLQRLRLWLTRQGPVAIAVSGGVDSVTLAAIASDWLGGQARLFHAVSAAVPEAATRRLIDLAQRRNWSLVLLDAAEFTNPNYRSNPYNRCYYCKTQLYRTIAARTDRQILSGTNLDDLGDYRPGLTAAQEFGVRHPYVELGITKTKLRALARRQGLSEIAELPASPCLASRVETGLPVRPELLQLIDRLETRIQVALQPDTLRCRLRAAGAGQKAAGSAPLCLMVELDAVSLDRLDAEMKVGLITGLAIEIERAGLDLPIDFARYRQGSAFIAPAEEMFMPGLR